MDFTNEFRVSLPVGPAWALLTDLERIAPCMPGAQLTGVEGEQYTGVVKVKVGPMTVQYKGVAAFEEQDADARTAVLRAQGRDVRGQGNADARITARLAPDGDGTRVTVETRLTITGKVAQFGKGMIEEISKKLLAQFADALEAQLATAEEAPVEEAPEAAPESAPEASVAAVPVPVMPAQVASVAPLELMSVARGALLKRAVPALVALVVVIALAVWLAR
ncbi:SRPBCC family protein [Streptomyces sp. NBC_01537]|uniref:SRPBCC family protein n=1 Tax=Streptomyces sp. NBC_01537 TaxID=2903896 RepID=UPI0038657F0A